MPAPNPLVTLAVPAAVAAATTAAPLWCGLGRGAGLAVTAVTAAAMSAAKLAVIAEDGGERGSIDVALSTDAAELAGRFGLPALAVRVDPRSPSLAVLCGLRRGGLHLRVSPGFASLPRAQRQAVMAHEYGHVAAGHPLRAALAVAGLWALPAVLAGLFAFAGAGPVVLCATAAAFAVAGTFATFACFRRQELAADRFVVERAGDRLAVTLAAMLDRRGVPPVTRLLDSHPSQPQRAVALRSRLGACRSHRGLTPADARPPT